MTGNNGTGNIEERDDWETPKWLFESLNNQYGFEFDCCANNKNNKCEYFTSQFLDQETKENRVSWMNPPFTKAKEMFKHFFKIIKKGIAIYRCDNLETAIWQDIILRNATWILIPKGRINYEGKVGKGSRFPSALIGYNVNPPRFLEGRLLIISR